MSETMIYTLFVSILAGSFVWFFAKESAKIVPWKRKCMFGFSLVVVGVALLGASLIGWNTGREAPRKYADDTPFERFLSGEEVIANDAYEMRKFFFTEVECWAIKHFPPEKRQEAIRAMCGAITKVKVRVEMPESIASHFTPLPDPHDNRLDDTPSPK